MPCGILFHRAPRSHIRLDRARYQSKQRPACVIPNSLAHTHTEWKIYGFLPNYTLYPLLFGTNYLPCL